MTAYPLTTNKLFVSRIRNTYLVRYIDQKCLGLALGEFPKCVTKHLAGCLVTQANKNDVTRYQQAFLAT